MIRVTPVPFMFDRAVNVSQLLALISGLAWIGIEAGKRDERLAGTIVRVNELAAIVQDLAKSQIAGATQDAGTVRELDGLRARIERLETYQRRDER